MLRPADILAKVDTSHVAAKLADDFGHDGLRALAEDKDMLLPIAEAAIKVLLVHHPAIAVAATAALHAAADSIAHHNVGDP